MKLYDQHTHSLHSHEKASVSTVAEMCEGAMERGMSGLSITDHCDIGRRSKEEVRGFLRASAEEVKVVQHELGDRFALRLGIELGEGHQDSRESAETVSLAPYDIVLGSLHNLRGKKDFSVIGKDFPDKAALFEEYLSEQIEMARWGGFDVLTHLTYPFRYYMLGEGMPNIRDYEERLRELFHILAQSGKGLEINSSGLFRPAHGKTMPELWELKLWRECGGEIVTTGSDAHDRTHAGDGIREAVEILRAAGFRYQAFFADRIPKMFPLE